MSEWEDKPRLEAVDGVRSKRGQIEFDMLPEGIFNPNKPPEHGIERVAGNEIAKGYVSIWAGYGGSGKSTLIYSIAMGIARGKRLAGPWIKQPMTALVINLEDDQVMVKRAMQATAEHYDVRYGEFVKPLYFWGEDKFAELINHRNGFNMLVPDPASNHANRINDKLRNALIDVIVASGADVVFIDPLASLFSGTVMDNASMNLLARSFSTMAKELNIAIVLVSHMRKPSGVSGQATQHDVKFGGELIDTSRSTSIITPLPQDLVTQWREYMPDEQDWDDIRMSAVTKSNIGKTGKKYYFKLVTKDVKCADDTVEEVVVPAVWNPPDLIRIPDLTIWPRLKEVIQEQFVRSEKRGRSPEGAVFLQDLILEIGEGAHDAKEVRRSMLNRGWVAEREEADPNSRSRREIKRIIVGPNDPDNEAPSDCF